MALEEATTPSSFSKGSSSLDDDESPQFQFYLTACNGNKKKARARLEATKKWRAENNIGE